MAFQANKNCELGHQGNRSGGVRWFVVPGCADVLGIGLLESALKAIAARFDNSAVKIDQTVFNASRITKAYGTMACKGNNIPERPHRCPECSKHPSVSRS